MPNLFSIYLLPFTLAIITLGMGLSIEAKDFKNIFLYPRSIITGLVSQIIFLPILGFLIAFSTDIDPLFKVGIVLISACPGGATSNLVNFMLNGNVALSISITAINSIISLFTIPIIVGVALNVFLGQETHIELPFLNTILNIFAVVVIPAFIGVLIRFYFPPFAIGLEKPLRYILPVILFTVFMGVILIDETDEAAKLIDYVNILPLVIALNVFSMLAGWLAGKFSGLSRRNSFTIAVEVGLQNSTLAIFIAATLLGSQMMAIVPIMYGSFSFFTTWGFGYALKAFGRRYSR
jgi:bile acid:Na+ symporter, BASS family